MNNTTRQKVNAARTVTAGLVVGTCIPFNSEIARLSTREFSRNLQQVIQDVVKIQAVGFESLDSQMEKLGETNLIQREVENLESVNA